MRRIADEGDDDDDETADHADHRGLTAEDDPKTYETMQSLLMAESPAYRQHFVASLHEKLAQLEHRQESP